MLIVKKKTDILTTKIDIFLVIQKIAGNKVFALVSRTDLGLNKLRRVATGTTESCQGETRLAELTRKKMAKQYISAF